MAPAPRFPQTIHEECRMVLLGRPKNRKPNSSIAKPWVAFDDALKAAVEGKVCFT